MQDPTYEESLRNWFHSLRDHDPYDVRGLLEGVAEVLTLIAGKIPPPAKAALTDTE